MYNLANVKYGKEGLDVQILRLGEIFIYGNWSNQMSCLLDLIQRREIFYWLCISFSMIFYLDSSPGDVVTELSWRTYGPTQSWQCLFKAWLSSYSIWSGQV